MNVGSQSAARLVLNLFNGSVLACAFFIPIASGISTRILVVALALSLFLPNPGLTIESIVRRTWSVVFYFLVVLVGLIYTENFETGLALVETNLAFLAIAIISIRVPAITEQAYNRIFYALTAGLFVACTVCLGNAIVRYSSGQSADVFFYYELTTVINSHPTYLAYYLIFSITILLYLVYYHRALIFFPLPVLFGLLLFFFVSLMLTGGRTAFISMLLIFSFFVLKYLLEPPASSKRAIFVLVCVMIAGMFVFNYQASNFISTSTGDYWERSVLWEAALEANTSVVFGVGTGDANEVLNEYYRQEGLEDFAQDNFNAHNQFIQTYLSHGLLGLVAVVVLMGRPLYQAATSQKPLGILVFFPFIIYGMTEVFLGRNQGIVFFALIHQVFVTYYQLLRPSLILKEG